MKKSNKIMSLLLAFAMVFSVVVPAFAEGNAVDETDVQRKDNFVFNLANVKGDKNNGTLVTLYKADVEKNGAPVEVANNKDGENFKDQLVVAKKAIEEGLTYYLVFGDSSAANLFTQLQKDDANGYYVFKAKADKELPETGKFVPAKSNKDAKTEEVKIADLEKSNDSVFKYDKFVKDEENYFEIISQDKNRNPVPNVTFSIVNLKNDGRKYLTDNGKFQIGDAIKDEYNNLTTGKEGVKAFTKDELSSLRLYADMVGSEKKVGIVVNHVLVAVVDLTDINSDYRAKRAIITPVPEISELIVKVVGLDRKVDNKNKKALKAIEGATVELLKNETEIFKQEKFGKVLDTQKTDANGVAKFTRPEISSFLDVLYPQIVESTSVKVNENTTKDEVRTKFGYVTTALNMPNGIKVNNVPNYQVPKFVLLTADNYKEENGVLTVTVQLLPADVSYNHRISGKNRYATSVEVAKKAFPEYDGKKGLILASGDVYADALVANGLVGLKDAPLVLNGVSKLDPSVKAYIKDLKAKELKKVTIVGGNGSVSGSVQKEIEELGLTTERIAGENRYDTSAKVLQYFYKNPEYRTNRGLEAKTKEVFLTSGENFADALVASVPAALYARPILLTAKDNLPKVVKDAIENKDYGISKVTVVGGTGSVSDKVYGSITISNIERLKGQNRQLTAMAVAKEYFMHAGEAIITNGQVYADALSAGQLAWKKNAPILLSNDANTISKELAQYLKDSKMTEITLVGGTSTLTDSLDKQVYEAITDK